MFRHLLIRRSRTSALFDVLARAANYSYLKTNWILMKVTSNHSKCKLFSRVMDMIRSCNKFCIKRCNITRIDLTNVARCCYAIMMSATAVAELIAYKFLFYQPEMKNIIFYFWITGILLHLYYFACLTNQTKQPTLSS